jgi:hypothetical protein
MWNMDLGRERNQSAQTPVSAGVPLRTQCGSAVSFGEEFLLLALVHVEDLMLRILISIDEYSPFSMMRI